MKLQLSNKTFYKRHNNELIKYIVNKKSLHIFAYDSFTKIDENLSEKLSFDIQNIKKNFKEINKKYEVVVLTDVIEQVDDINLLMSEIKKIMKNDGKLVLSSINPKYYLLIKIFEILKLKQKNQKFSYIHNKKIDKVVNGFGFEYIHSSSKQIFPFKLFNFGNILNLLLESVFFFFNIGIKTYSVFRIQSDIHKEKKLKTIIVPAKNEEGNLEILFSRIPKHESYEIIFSIGKSSDKTLDIANKIQQFNTFHNVVVIEQTKNGKANAVWEALDISKGEFIAILDADISVEPELIPEFFKILEENKADFVNGTRLIYEMEHGAMRYLNKLGNRLFQYLISKVLRVDLTDSLCGTKVFKKDLILNIKWWQSTYNLYDPFGDFDLLFSSIVTGDKVLELPVHYKSRIYGKTQISRFRDGFKLFRYMFKSYLVFTTSKNKTS